MHKTINFISLILFPIFFIFIQAEGSLLPIKLKHEGELNILAFTNNNRTWPFTNEVYSTLEKELERESSLQVNLKIQTVDFESFNDEEIDQMTSLMKKRYYKSIDIILVQDISKINKCFIAAFDSVPVFVLSHYIGNSISDDIYKRLTYIRGIEINVKPTVDAALKCCPNTEQIIIISGSSPLDMFWYKSSLLLGKQYKKVKIKNWHNWSVDSITSEITKLPKNSLVVYESITNYKMGHFVMNRDILLKIKKHSSVPVFGIADTYLNGSVIGGYMHSAIKDGLFSANVINRWLNGEKIKGFMHYKNYGQYIFDWEEMEKWDIKERNLPRGSKIINRPVSFFNRHTKLLSCGLIFCFLLSVSMIILLIISKIKSKAKESINKSNAEFKSLFEHSGIRLFSFNTNFELIKANVDMIKSLERYVENPIGKNVVELYGKANSKSLLKHIKKCIRTTEDQHFIERIDRSGDIQYYHTNCTCILDKKQRPVRIQIAAIDITPRMQAKEALRESEIQFRSLFEESNDAIIICRTDGQIVDANKKIVKYIKILKKDLIKLRMCDLANRMKNFSDKEVFEKEIGIIDKVFSYEKNDNEISYIDVKSKLLNYKKGLVQIIIRDITKTKKYEIELENKKSEAESINEELKKINNKLLIEKDKVDRANKLKDDFLHNMSHEVRTPMNGIIGFSNLLNDPEVDEAKRKLYISIINKSSKQLLHIIDDIVEISCLETKQVSIIKEELCLNVLMRKLFDVYNIKATEKNISLYLKNGLIDKDSIILSDKTKLNKILVILLENAIKYILNGFVEFGYYVQNKDFVIYVKDTGIGILPENYKTIFDCFYQVEEESFRNKRGLGLGLSIAKGNTELLGGKISLESKIGEGTTFYITFPCNIVKPDFKSYITNESKTEVQNEIGNLAFEKKDKQTILIAEDEKINIIYLKELLKHFYKYDPKVLIAKNGKEAVKICRENDVDLILMDIKMPIMGGLEASKTIKIFKPNVPIIAQTAYSTNEDKNLALKSGCDDFISKPITKDDFLNIITKYLN